MYTLLFLLLLTAPVSANPEVIHYCQELIIEADKAVELGIINKQEAEDLIQGCLRLEE